MSGAARPWTIRDYEEGDEHAIVALFEAVFGKPMGATESLAHWRWEYAENPTGPRAIKLAWHGDRLAGQYAANPVRMWVDGAPGQAVLSLDTMTHGDYRGQGMFPTLAGALYDDLARRGVSFVYGFPNAQSVKGFVKRLAWRELFPMPVRVRPVDLGPLVARRFGRGGTTARLLSRPALRMAGSHLRGRGIRVTAEADIEGWADGLWQRCRNQHRIWAIRDRAYLNWRYAARPETAYTFLVARRSGGVVGLAVVRDRALPVGPITFVADLLADREVPGAADALLRAVVAHARRAGTAAVSAVVVPGSAYAAAFRRQLFVQVPERWFPQEIHFGARQLAGSVDPALFEDPGAWCISWGDVDVL